MSKFAEYQKEATPDRKTVRVCFDRQLLSDLEAAELELKELTASGMMGDDRRTKTQERVESLKAKVREKARPITFEMIGRRRWRDLLAEHPPTDEQREQFGRILDHNPETFPAAAMAASCSDPGMTEADAQWLLDELPVAVVDKVWATCLGANVTGSRDPFEEGSDGARASTKK